MCFNINNDNFLSQIKQQIWVYFTHLKLCFAVARHIFKWMKNYIRYFGVDALVINTKRKCSFCSWIEKGPCIGYTWIHIKANMWIYILLWQNREEIHIHHVCTCKLDSMDKYSNMDRETRYYKVPWNRVYIMWIYTCPTATKLLQKLLFL